MRVAGIQVNGVHVQVASIQINGMPEKHNQVFMVCRLQWVNYSLETSESCFHGLQ